MPLVTGRALTSASVTAPAAPFTVTAGSVASVHVALSSARYDTVKLFGAASPLALSTATLSLPS